LKVNKADLNGLQDNIDAAKEQLIFQFEKWYEEEFEIDPTQDQKVNLGE